MSHTLRTVFLLTLLACCLAGPSTQAAVLDLTGPDGASVAVNGRLRGYFPLEHPLDLGPGRYLVECSLPGHKDFSWTVVLDDESDWQRLHVRMTRYRKTTAVGSNILLAGLGQHYLDKPAKGWLFNIAEAGGLLTALVAEASRSNHRKDYLVLLEKYETGLNSEDLAYYRQKASETYQDMEDMEKLRDTGIMVAGGAIVLSMLDAWLLFPAVEVGPGPGVSDRPDANLDYSGTDLGDHLTTIHAGIKLGF
jgi:hypothetical protein